MANLDPDLVWYYERGREASRLKTVSQLEAVRTRAIISARLEGSGLSVVDIGAGPGAYACWLANEGHSVHVVDPVQSHLNQAKNRASELDVEFASVHLATAEELPFDDAAFDVALLLGPLYHLSTHAERLKVLREVRRVLKSNGLLFAAGIGRYSAVVDGFFGGHVATPDFVRLMRQTVTRGEWHNSERREGLFTTSFFHRPEQLRSELMEAGFAEPEVLAVESVWPWIPDFDRKWKDPDFRSLLLEMLEHMEADPSVVGLGGHLMAVSRNA